MEVVLDASVALAWALPDERSSVADRLLSRAEKEMVFWVPALWWYEVTNALLVAVRRKRLKEDDRMKIMEIYGILPVYTDTDLDEKTMTYIHTIASMYGLSAYDASYLELAKRKNLSLATLDDDLSAAAKKAEVVLVF